MALELSIIIVSWNTRDVLRACLDSVFGTCRSRSFEVLVVDNASMDGSAEMVERHFPQVRLIRNSENVGFARANNIAMRQAVGAVFLLLNSDTVVLEDAIERAMQTLDRDPTIGVVGGRAVYPDGSFQSTYYRVHTLGDLFMLRLLPFDLVPRNRLNRSRYWGQIFTEPREVEVVAGCFFFVRARVANSVGLFDEDFFMYGEEEEWCHRIRKHGWTLMHEPEARIIHIHGFSSRKGQRRLSLVSRSAPLLVLEKTRGGLTAWLGNLIMALGALIRFPIWIGAALVPRRRVDSIGATLQRRTAVLGFHLRGLVGPVWRPARQVSS